MNLREEVINELEIFPIGELPVSRRQPTNRLDYTGTKEPTAGFTTAKIVKSGNLVEVYDYKYPIKFGSSGKKEISKRKNQKNEIDPARYEENRIKTIIRAINSVRRLIYLNFSDKDMFLTLTFNNEQSFNINDLTSCSPYFKKFVRKTREIYPNFKYIVVPEFQKRGAVHYHLICNLSFLSEDERNLLWPYGFSKPKTINGTTHLSLYLCKYLSKKFDDKRKEKHRLFYSSRGLIRPKTAYGEVAEKLSRSIYLDQTIAIEYETQYKTKHNGNVLYRQYLLKK